MTNKNEKNREQLITLLRKNPDLTIVPMVDADFYCDNLGYYMGAIGNTPKIKAIIVYMNPPENCSEENK